MNNYNFTQSLDGLNNIEADMINTSNLNVGSLVVDTAEITTLSDCNLVNCTSETPANNTSVVNKTYVDSNFLDRTNNLTQNINGLKTFTDDLTAPNIYCNTALYFRDINLGLNKALIFHQADIVYFDTLTVFNNYWKFKCFNIEQVVISQLSSTFNNKLISLEQARFDNFTPTCTVSSPTQINHLTRKDYVDNNFLDRTNNLTQNINGLKTFTNDITFNAQSTFNNFTPICSVATPSANNHLTRKDYVDNNFLDRTNNLTQNINGLKTFTNVITFNAQTTFNNSCPISSVSPTAGNHLTRRDYVENNFVDKTSNQIITGVKTFDGTTSYNGTALFCNCPGEFANLVHLRNFTRVYDVISPFTNYTQFYTTGNNFIIYPVSVNSGIYFFCRNAGNTEVQTFSSTATANTSYVPFVASTTATFNGESTFNNLVHLKNTTRMYDLITPFTNYTSFYTSGNASVIYAGFAGSSIQFYCRTAGNLDVQTFYSFATANTSVVPFVASSTATFNGEADFNTWVNLKFRTRVYDLGNASYTQIYMLGGNEFIIAPNNNGDFISFYCKDAVLGQLQTFKSSALGNTSLVKLTCSSSLVSNNLTAPTTTSVNNIYTTLVSGGEVNLGSQLSANYIFGETTFNSSSIFNLGCTFLGSLTFFNSGTFSEIEQTSGSNLVLRNITNTRNITLSTTSASTGQVDSLTINTTSCDILSPTLNLTSASTINVLTPNNLTGVINFFSTLTTATVNFCSTAYTSVFNLNARLAHKGVQYMNEVKIISGTALTLVFPIEQRWQFTSAGATQVVIDLPQITATSQTGFYFTLFKTASNTNSVKINRQGTNVIRSYNSITDLTTATLLSGTGSSLSIITAEISAGVFAWIVTA